MMERLDADIARSGGPWICGEAYSLADICVAPRESILASADADGEIRFWDYETKEYRGARRAHRARGGSHEATSRRRRSATKTRLRRYSTLPWASRMKVSRCQRFHQLK